MKKRILYIIWAAMYLLCAGLGHITEPSVPQTIGITIFAFLFFVPAVLILACALKHKDKKNLLRLRWISAVSLGLTLVLVIANFLSVYGAEALGNVLHELLVLFSVPLFCFIHWTPGIFLSLFFWACILFATLPAKKSS